MNGSLMPSSLDIREVFYTNLLILDFNSEKNEAQYRQSFDRDMFAVPNKKCMEVVIYFLFTRLNQSYAKETFRNSWPIIDRKKEQEFRKITIEWLAKIKKSDADCQMPNIVPSLLLSPGGEKFYQFVFHFSTYVIKKKILSVKDKNSVLPSLPSALPRKHFHQVERAMTAVHINAHHWLTSQLKETDCVRKHWVEFARELLEEQKRLQKLYREIVRRCSERKCGIEESARSSKKVLRRTQKLQQMTELWETMSAVYQSQKTLQSDISRVLGEQLTLSEKHIEMRVPDNIMELSEKYNTPRLRNLYAETRLNLTSVVRLWNLSLHVLRDTLDAFPLKDMDNEMSYFKSEIQNHSCHLEQLVQLRNALKIELVDDAHNTINHLSSRSLAHSHLNFDLLPSTPSVPMVGCFATPTNIVVNEISDDGYVCTPKAVRDILSNVSKHAETVLMGRIPTRNTNKTLRGHDISKTREKSRKIPRYAPNQLKKKPNNTSRILDNLTDEISSSVIMKGAVDSRSSSEEEQEMTHALKSPLSALTNDAFLRKDKCPRTPAKKSSGDRLLVSLDNPRNKTTDLNSIKQRLKHLNTDKSFQSNSEKQASDLLAIKNKLKVLQEQDVEAIIPGIPINSQPPVTNLAYPTNLLD